MATATFSFKPDFAWKPALGWRVDITTFENGKEQRSDRGAEPRVWTLSFTRSAAVMKEIQAFWLARHGQAEAFYWTPPDETAAILVRFSDDTMEPERSGQLYGKVELKLKEIL